MTRKAVSVSLRV